MGLNIIFLASELIDSSLQVIDFSEEGPFLVESEQSGHFNKDLDYTVNYFPRVYRVVDIVSVLARLLRRLDRNP